MPVTESLPKGVLLDCGWIPGSLLAKATRGSGPNQIPEFDRFDLYGVSAGFRPGWGGEKSTSVESATSLLTHAPHRKSPEPIID